MWEKIKSILTTTKYQVRIGLAVVLIFLGGYNLFFIGDDEGHGDNISIKIESGMSTEEIAQNLQEHAIINNGLGFRILARLEGKDTQFKEGIYYFRVGMNINSVLDRLVQGSENQVVRITIPEGFTVEDIANLLEKIMCGDNYDSNPKCVIEGEYDLGKVGNYKLVFKAEDSSGNVSEKKFTLNVNEPSNNESSNRVKSVTKFNDVIKDYKTDNTQIGIDVSKWQGDIDFRKLKKAGVEFVIIRVGSSNGINGENFVDSKFIQNIKNANSVGIPVGVYFYSYANSVDRAISDAKWIIEQIKDYKVDLPIAFDWENWGSFNKYELSFFGLTNMAKKFMDTVKASGYDAMLYSSKTYLKNIWMSADYPVWLAHYTKNTNYTGDYSYWQLCSNGRVDGISGDVDIDIRYID